MLKKCFRLLLMLMLVTTSSVFAQVNPTPGVIRVKLQPEVAAKVGAKSKVATMSNGVVQTGITPLDASAKKIKAVRIQRVFPYVEKYEAQRKKYGLDRWYEITFDESVNPLEAKAIYAKTAGVQIAEVCKPMQLLETGRMHKVDLSKNVAKASETTMPFNDPGLSKQWHYHNDGSMAGAVAGADINLFKAWKETTGSKNVLVAIVDGGVDYNHPDLKDNMWVNEAELNGKPGVDDDGDGYVDDIYGYNFVTNNGEIYPHNHGTHVAGTVGAVNNNGIGVCGVAGGSGHGGVKMISCQVFDPRTNGGDFAKALVYAAERGASIAQCSWGWTEPGYKEQDVLDAIDYFTEFGGGDNMKGGLCIFAFGNLGLEGEYYPGAYDKVVNVASMTYDGRAASYSNYGKWVDVTAPGGNIELDEKQGVLSTFPDNSYGYYEGTSMATPHVSGIAALVLSKYGNKNLYNETLRSQLVNSVNDFYTLNPTVEGKFGSGYIDANKAVNMSAGEAPESVSDFSLLASQDNILVEWTIPASSSDVVNHHVIYYSTTPFDASSDLSKIPNKTVDTKFYYSGDKISYEIPDLSPETTYYVAIEAVSALGDCAAISPVKTATTNAGPEMVIDKDYLSMSVNPSAATSEDSFTIGNSSEGVLKWSAYKRLASISPASNTTALPGKVVNAPKMLSIVPFNNYPVVKSDEYMAEDFPKQMNYSSLLSAYIGETNPKLPNSEAQLFKVDAETYPDGFNLTHLQINGQNGEDPVIEIYDGSKTISQASLIQRVDYDWFTYGYPIALKEQLYFAPGESFWVVYHFAAGNVNPLGLGEADTDDYYNYSYMSNDMGKTWTVLKDALAGGSFEDIGKKAVWDMAAISKNPDWSTLLTITPESGIVKQGESQKVTVSNDGQPLVNGTYNFNVKFNTNESKKSIVSIPVNFVVSDYPAELHTAKVINFGDLLVGQSKTLSVEVTNLGYGGFYGAAWSAGLDEDAGNITSTSVDFIPETYISEGFPARAKTNFKVTFKPTKAGPCNGNIVFTDKDKKTFTVMVHGVASDPSKIVLSPAEIQAGDIEVGGEDVVKELTIKNEGSYPLEYVFPKFSTETIEGMGKTSHRYGYEYYTNIGEDTSFAYDNNPELLNATDITSSFNDRSQWSEAIPLDFDFMYYGKTYNKVYITSCGGVAFEKGTLRGVLDASDNSIGNTGLISAYGMETKMNDKSKVSYAKQDGKFVVSFKDVLAVVYGVDYTPVSFHMSLSSNGDIEMFYDSYEPSSVFEQGTDLFIGVNDPGVNDPCTYTASSIANKEYITERTEEGDRYLMVTSGSAVRFAAPGKNMIKELSSTSGIVNPGETQTITATLAATDDMYAGALKNKLVILSNDPVNPSSSIDIYANITGDLQPACELDTTEVNFGSVFRTAKKTLPLTIKNTGRNDLEITSVALQSGKFEIEAETPATVKAGNSKDVSITIPTNTEGAVSDVISIVTSAGTLTADIKGEVIGVPQVAVNPTEFSEEMASGTTMEKTINIKNEGNEPLVYSITPNSFVGMPTLGDEESKMDYIYKASDDDESVSTDWYDIETNGLGYHDGISTYLANDFIEVELPFEFPFYGKNYTKMYVYNTGFISFNKHDNSKDWPDPPAEFPKGTIYDNIMAPYWGLHSPGDSKIAGTYHYESDDKVVVSFMDYNNTMNIGVCYQAILNKDGSFKYQYKGYGENAFLFGTFGYAGTSSINAAQSTILPERLIKFGSAVEFYPVATTTLAANSSKDLNLVLKADRLAGDYSSNLVINTNIPQKEVVNVPVNLKITGEAHPVFPDSIGGEAVMGSSNDGPAGNGYFLEFPFEISNTGTASFTISNIAVNLPQGDFGTDVSLYNYGEHFDWLTGQNSLSWAEYDLYEQSPIEIGKTPAKFSFVVNEKYAPITYELPITLTLEGLDGETTKVLPCKIVITPAPLLTFDKDSIKVDNAAYNYKGVESFNIKNTGDYKLTYELRLDPTGEGEDENGGGNGGDGGVAPTSHKMNLSALNVEQDSIMKQMIVADNTIKPMDDAKDNSIFNVPRDFDYTNALYYPAFPGNMTNYSYGMSNTYSDFRIATNFVAPAGGFNLSKIYLAFTSEDCTNLDLKIDIMQGDDPEGEVRLGGGKRHFDKAAEPNYYLIDMDKPIYLSEGQKFCVVVKYPIGLKNPAFLCVKEEATVANRYLAWSETNAQWYDAAAYLKENYGNVGYILSCIETEKGEPWIKLLTPETSGKLAVNDSTKIDIQMNAISAPLDKGNKAVLVIKSNDPDHSVVNYPITLNKNSVPVITVPENTTFVKENETANLDIFVKDEDGDAMTVTINDNYGIASIESVKPETGDDVKTSIDGNTAQIGGTTNGVHVILALKPTYGQANMYNVTINATDANNLSADETAQFYVEHSNRAPVAKPVDKVSVVVNAASELLNFADMFEDPDGDDMTYEVTLSNNNAVTMLQSATNLIFFGLKQGASTTVTVKATDKYGAEATNTFKVVVTKASGVATVDEDSWISVYPNPVETDTKVEVATSGAVAYRLFDVNGALVYDQENATAVQTINMSNLCAGVYYLEVATDAKTSVITLLKK